MKNREFRTLIAVIAMTGTLITSATAGAFPAYAADTTGASDATEVRVTSVNTSNKGKSVAKPYKDETVYATIDGNGSVKEVTVSDQLKNISELAKVTDKSSLQNIENVKGDEAFSRENGLLTWSTADADICYQGTSTSTLPVAVKVTYTLDGRQLRAEELKGKSGHLVIHYAYENNSPSYNGVKTPFLMATGLVLDSNIFKNVTLKNGRLISDGEKDIALGLAFPSFQEMLGTNNLDLPESFEIEADVTNYEPAEAMTIATNSFFNDLDEEHFDNLGDLEASLNQLQDASRQLVDGSGELRKGLDTLLTSSGSLTDGIQKLADGSQTLANGTTTLKDGAARLSDGLNTASTKVSSELLPGIRQLNSGMKQMQGSLGEQLPTLAGGVSSLNNGISQVADGTAALSDGVKLVANGMAGLHAGLNTAGAGVATIHEKMTATAPEVAQLSAGAAALSGGTAQLAEALAQLAQAPAPAPQTDPNTNWDEIQTLQTLRDSGAITDEAVLSTIDGVISTLTAEQTSRENASATPQNGLPEHLSALSASANALASNAQLIANGTAAVNAQFQNGNGTTLYDGISLLYGALNPTNGQITAAAAQLDQALNTGLNGKDSLAHAAARLSGAMNIGDQTQGTPSLRDGASTLNQAINGTGGLTEQVQLGVGQLSDGASRLLAGVDGTQGLAAGLNQLNNGASALLGGSTELHTGANALASGVTALRDGSGKLIDGVKQLDEGAAKLNDGMIQFDKDGIQKLVNVFNGDINNLLEKANDMLDASRAYKNFSGIADHMDGEVKFVFVTE